MGDALQRSLQVISFIVSLAVAPRVGRAGTDLPENLGAADIKLIDRITFGVNGSSAAGFLSIGRDRWLEVQLHPGPKDRLPAPGQAIINAMPISNVVASERAMALAAQARAANQIQDAEQKKVAQQSYQHALNDLARQAATRSLLRDLYSPDQLREKMTWFWFNHFNVSRQVGYPRGHRRL